MKDETKQSLLDILNRLKPILTMETSYSRQDAAAKLMNQAIALVKEAADEKVDAICKNCKFYRSHKVEGLSGTVDNCHRFPKRATVSSHYWCGEFKKGEKK